MNEGKTRRGGPRSHRIVPRTAMPLLVCVWVVAGCSSNDRPSARVPERGWLEVGENGRIAPPQSDAFAATWDHEHFAHDLWNAALIARVNDQGLVDYAGMRDDPRFREYLHRLAHTDPAGLPGDEAKLAFWINAYNALTIQGVLATLGVDKSAWPNYRILDYRHKDETFWKSLQFNVGGKWYTLDRIEHDLLRKMPGLQDSRMHLALVCAAKGCPPLWNRAFTPGEIDSQLNARGHAFVSSPERCRFDRGMKTVTTSRIFDWYHEDFVSEDFTPHAESIPAYLAIFVEDDDLARSLRRDNWRVEYMEYDWHLNIQSP